MDELSMENFDEIFDGICKIDSESEYQEKELNHWFC